MPSFLSLLRLCGRIPALLGVLTVAGCLSPEPFPTPRPPLPDHWTHVPPIDPARSNDPAASPRAIDPWWRTLGSPTLDTLESDLLAHHPDIASAAARLDQARIRARIAESPLFPSLSLDTSERLSQRGNSGTTRASSFSGPIVQATQASLSASYELDYRGRNRTLAQKAAYEAEAGRLERATLHWSLTADLASSYIKLLTLKTRRALARQSRETAGKILELVVRQVDLGHASPLDAVRQQNTVASIDAQLAAMELQHHQTLDALALLSGKPLAEVSRLEGSLDQLRLPLIQPGLPSTLLARRPDIRQAEATLQAAHADLQAARATLFPTIQLTGERGYSSAGLSSLISPGSAFWNLSASLVATLFDHGKTRGAIELAESERQAAVAAYQKAVLSALKDVEDNLAAVHWLAEQEKAQQRAESAAQESWRLAEARHQAGAVDFLTVLEAQRSLLQTQDERPQIRQARLNAAIGLFKALGGEIPDNAAPQPESLTPQASNPQASNP
ncbi:MAG: efflux transporter outer membrane subunit [Magnetococcales bacterium]|nr:efflux transporter outer membrane subunit [Magnetococcales bacterium]